VWFLVVLCSVVGDFALLHMLGIRFPPVRYEIPITTLLAVYLVCSSFVSVATAAKYYKRIDK
jgi:hypothetical protein